MKRLAILAAALAMVALAGCEPTGDPRCDANLRDIQVQIEAYGWHLSCAPPASDARYSDFGQFGQTGPDQTVWIWADRTIDFGGIPLLRQVAWHELGHVTHITRGVVFDSPDAREQWADGFSWCKEQIQGVGYTLMPEDCTTYR
jgi:hypothetical protein